MLVLNAEEARARAPMPRLIECLREAFRKGALVPHRQVIRAPGGEGERLFLAMPAFDFDGAGAVKLASVFPDNPARGLPAIQASIVVFSKDGTPQAVVDGAAVTKLRTSAASALASTYLSRADSAHLAIFGTGELAPYMAMAHCTVRPIRRVSVCGRDSERVNRAVTAIRSLVERNIEISAAASAEEAVSAADIVSCATNSATPVFAGKWLKPGAFVDLVGSFSPTKREADDDAVRRARIFVDTFEGALAEAGDLLDPLQRGIIGRERIEGELADLATGRVQGRSAPEEITLFKSVGTALEDLAAAQMIVHGS